MLLFAGALALLGASLTELIAPPLAASALFCIVERRPYADVLARIGPLTIVAVVYGALTGASRFAFHAARNIFVRRLRTQTFEALLAKDTGFHDETDAGELTTRISSDSQAIFNALNDALNFLLASGVTTVCGFVALMRISPRVTVVVAVVSVALMVCTEWYGEVSRWTARRTQDSIASLNRIAKESLGMLRTVRALNAEETHKRLYLDKSQEVFEIQRRRGIASGLFGAASSGLATLARAAALLVGGLLLLRPDSSLTGEALTAYLLYLDLVTENARGLGLEWSFAMEALGAGERVLALVSGPPTAQSGSRRLDAVMGELTFKDVTFAYPSRPGRLALDRVSFTCKAGCKTAVVGYTGSGKSSMLALAQRLYDPDCGRVLLDGVDLRELDTGWLRAQLSVVAQQPNLFQGTVAENISWGLAGTTIEEIREAAQLAGIDELISDLPEGYDTLVGDTKLSTAQRQQIAIARALVRDPAVLLLDEPTSALDPATSRLVVEALCPVPRSSPRSRPRTVVIVAHRLDTVEDADEVLVFEAGRLAEQGPPAELLAKGGIYARLVDDQRLPTEHTPHI